MSSGPRIGSADTHQKRFPLHGWLGLALAGLFWFLNWSLEGPRTHLGFFPMWLGYCLAVDGLVVRRTGTSLLTRSLPRFAGLFAISAPVWWLFEALNLRTHNWIYQGAEVFTPIQYFLLTTLSFSTVLPAVFESAEFFASFDFLKRVGRGPVIGAHRWTVAAFFAAGWIMLALLLIWPRVLFLFVWISVYFILEPLNVWMGSPSLAEYTRRGDWRPVLALWLGVLMTAFFWEMWNYYSWPKWTYDVPWGNWLHLFEMPLLGYGGYLPFALELHAMYYLVLRLLGEEDASYLRLYFVR